MLSVLHAFLGYREDVRKVEDRLDMVGRQCSSILSRVPSGRPPESTEALLRGIQRGVLAIQPPRRIHGRPLGAARTAGGAAR